jgi:hypothetical protein
VSTVALVVDVAFVGIAGSTCVAPGTADVVVDGTDVVVARVEAETDASPLPSSQPASKATKVNIANTATMMREEAG